MVPTHPSTSNPFKVYGCKTLRHSTLMYVDRRCTYVAEVYTRSLYARHRVPAQARTSSRYDTIDTMMDAMSFFFSFVVSRGCPPRCVAPPPTRGASTRPVLREGENKPSCSRISGLGRAWGGPPARPRRAPRVAPRHCEDFETTSFSFLDVPRQTFRNIAHCVPVHFHPPVRLLAAFAFRRNNK